MGRTTSLKTCDLRSSNGSIMASQESRAVAVALSNKAVLHIESTRLNGTELEKEVVDVDRLSRAS
jgi:hypothetical protein